MTAPASASGAGQDNNLVALSLMSGAMMIVPIMDVIAKYLSLSLPPLEVTFGRFVFQLLISLAVAGLTWNLKGLRSKRPMVNYLRGILLSAAVLCFFTAVKYMPVATSISIFFVEPMILTILAALILKEKVGLRRITAILTGTCRCADHFEAELSGGRPCEPVTAADGDLLCDLSSAQPAVRRFRRPSGNPVQRRSGGKHRPGGCPF